VAFDEGIPLPACHLRSVRQNGTPVRHVSRNVVERPDETSQTFGGTVALPGVVDAAEAVLGVPSRTGVLRAQSAQSRWIRSCVVLVSRSLAARRFTSGSRVDLRPLRGLAPLAASGGTARTRADPSSPAVPTSERLRAQTVSALGLLPVRHEMRQDAVPVLGSPRNPCRLLSVSPTSHSVHWFTDSRSRIP